MQDQGKWLEEFLECRKQYDDEKTPVWTHTMQAYQAAFNDGAVDSKHKHLMALCIGMSDHCAPCTLGHLKAAIQAGAGKDEILEAVGVTLSMCGTTAMGGTWRVFQYMREEGMF
jgi:AhpD family alkylhydroperoxidase